MDLVPFLDRMTEALQIVPLNKYPTRLSTALGHFLLLAWTLSQLAVFPLLVDRKICLPAPQVSMRMEQVSAKKWGMTKHQIRAFVDGCRKEAIWDNEDTVRTSTFDSFRKRIMSWKRRKAIVADAVLLLCLFFVQATS